MDHSYIEEYDFVDRYLMGKLAAEESAQFEEHFVDCRECISRLRATEDFLQGLRLATARLVSEADDPKPKSLFPYYPQIFSRRPMALAASILVASVILGAIFMASQMWRLQSGIDQAEADAAQWERLYEEERQNASSAEKRFQDKEQQLTEQLRELESGLRSAQRPGSSDEAVVWTQPAINLPIFLLNSARRTGQNSSDEVNEVALGKSPVGFVLFLGLEGDVKYRDYRVSIFGDDNRLIWKGGGLRPNPYNSLSIGLNSRSYPPGNYLLRVEGIDVNGVSSLVGNYPFRVKISP